MEKDNRSFREKLKVGLNCDREYYRVYDKNRNHIKDIAIEEERFLTNEYLDGVTCFVVNEEGKILMEVRANTELTPGKIDLVSGHVNGSEIGLFAIQRELREEVGYNYNGRDQLYILTEKPVPLSFESGDKIRNFFINFYCLITKTENITKIQKEEVESLHWVDMDEAFRAIKDGKTKFPKQDWENVNYDWIFKKVERAYNPQRDDIIENTPGFQEFCRGRIRRDNEIEK